MSVIVDGDPGGSGGDAGGSGWDAGNGDTVTIGVALPVPEPFGDELQRWRAEFGDPLADAIPAHITLLPPSRIPSDAVERVCMHLEDVAASLAPFDLQLRGTGTFRPISPVVFVQVAKGVANCEQLERTIRSGPLERGLSFYYHPHVTIAHHLDDAALDHAFETLATYEASFVADSFSLYEHGDDGVWRAVEHFPLVGQSLIVDD